MQRINTELLVIGAGSGGLSVAAGASRMGAGVVLLEGHEMGGDCLNHGCVPSKALIAAAAAAHAQGHSGGFGVADVIPAVDYAGAMDHVRRVIARIAPVDSQARFEGFGVRVIREYGTFLSPTRVRAGDYEITARRVVIATGSSPLVPPIPGLDSVPYQTNETLFDLREKPPHLLILGGGPIGMEMAQAHVRLGCRVTVIEGRKVLGRDDPELVAVLLQALRAEGVEIAEGAMAARVRGPESPGQARDAVAVESADGRVFRGSHLLVALGRKPNTERLNLAAAGIEATRAGITVDAALRTANKRVYAIGDVAAGMQFTHVAGYHAGVVIRSALFGLRSRARDNHIPYATYCDPELAQVGLSEHEARLIYGVKLEVARFDYHHNDRAVTTRRTEGFIKVMVFKSRPVGVSIVGHQAGELIGLWSLAIANRMKMGQIAAMVSPYPTFAEVNKRVAGAYFSPRLFDNAMVRRVVGFVQRWIP